jgi:hypothetical protein
MKTLTAYEIMSLLKYDHGDHIGCSNRTKQTRADLIAIGLMEDSGVGSTIITEKGKAFIRMIENTPLPVHGGVWLDPRD